MYQIEDTVTTKKVTIEERMDGSFHIMSKGVSLKYREITERPRKVQIVQDRRVHNSPPVPLKNHPWRKWDEWNSKPKKRIYP
jgi:hypothetical protein